MNSKQAIINAATLLFSERGYNGTTTAAIAKTAGITQPCIHYHFKSKEDLFLQCVNALWNSRYYDPDDCMINSIIIVEILTNSTRLEAIMENDKIFSVRVSHIKHSLLNEYGIQR